MRRNPCLKQSIPVIDFDGNATSELGGGAEVAKYVFRMSL